MLDPNLAYLCESEDGMFARYTQTLKQAKQEAEDYLAIRPHIKLTIYYCDEYEGQVIAYQY